MLLTEHFCRGWRPRQPDRPSGLIWLCTCGASGTSSRRPLHDYQSSTVGTDLRVCPRILMDFRQDMVIPPYPEISFCGATPLGSFGKELSPQRLRTDFSFCGATPLCSLERELSPQRLREFISFCGAIIIGHRRSLSEIFHFSFFIIHSSQLFRSEATNRSFSLFTLHS